MGSRSGDGLASLSGEGSGRTATLCVSADGAPGTSPEHGCGRTTPGAARLNTTNEAEESGEMPRTGLTST
jgi:hypothetical protein